jgi:hypothetical protein
MRIDECVSCDVAAVRLPVFECVATKYNVTKDDSPYYKYITAGVLESDNYRLYWNCCILTDKTIARNRSDVTFTEVPIIT